jgi:hypothetical protein
MDELSSTLPVQLSLLVSEGLTQQESGRIADATPPVERLSFDRFSERTFPEGPHIDDGVLRYGGPFLPVFLNDPSIRRAMKRADELHIERHGHPAIPVPVSDSYGRLSAIGDGRFSALDFHPSLGPSDHEGSSSNADGLERGLISSSVFPSARESGLGSPLPAKFGVPGQETASVLQISKRPKLRPKDIAHRKSLAPVSGDQALMSFMGMNVGSPFPASSGEQQESRAVIPNTQAMCTMPRQGIFQARMFGQLLMNLCMENRGLACVLRTQRHQSLFKGKWTTFLSCCCLGSAK